MISIWSAEEMLLCCSTSRRFLSFGDSQGNDAQGRQWLLERRSIYRPFHLHTLTHKQRDFTTEATEDYSEAIKAPKTLLTEFFSQSSPGPGDKSLLGLGEA